MSTKSRTKQVRESYNLPDSKSGIVGLVSNIIDGGSVQKIVIELHKPIFVYRNVEVSQFEEPDTELETAIRSIDVIEYLNPEDDPFQSLCDLFQIVSDKRLVPVYFVTGAGSVVEEWLQFEERGVPLGSAHLMGLPLKRLGSLPEETLALCAAEFAEAAPWELSLAIKTTMEVRRGDQGTDEADAGSGDYSAGERKADGGMETVTTRGNGDLWVPKGILGIF